MLETQNFQLAPIYHRLLTEPGLRGDALRGLAAYDVPTTPPAILAVYASFTREEKRVALGLLAARPLYARELVAALAEGRIPRTDFDASLAREMRLHGEPELDLALTRVWGVARETPAETAAAIARWKTELTPVRLAAADLHRGRELYLATCASCHVLYSDGRGDLDYLLRNILDPNADIGRDNQLVTIELADGRIAAGIVIAETAAAITLVNQAETVTLSKEQIRRQERLEVSLMPAGLFSALTEPDVADLIAYLQTTAPLR
jgi:putative heme-binding domain-containing protein